MAKASSDKRLMYLFMHIEKLLHDRLRSSLGEENIHFGQARILGTLLQHGKLTQKTIAHGLFIKPATVTNLVKKMETSGLIDRRRDSNDDRVINVTLTSKGKEAANVAEKVMAQIEHDIRSVFTPAEIETLRIPLLKIRNKFGGSDPTI